MSLSAGGGVLRASPKKPPEIPSEGGVALSLGTAVQGLAGCEIRIRAISAESPEESLEPGAGSPEAWAESLEAPAGEARVAAKELFRI